MSLHGKQFRLQAADRKNRSVPFFLSMEVKGILHIVIGSGSDQTDIYLKAAELRDALIELATGRKIVAGKHARKGETNESL